ncbi:ectoine/hydroxyectoine ABC transporter substrate-binding protein EhuB [Marinitenerispora sediminis]|uniref:Ectoine/hydroxyectoine ABC transporter substrate-binding protein EhuB n=1 Tax=Marinitenerispora sediminis TaxID=1931232 RepID=A0A368T3R3_9ACTN|nr:ectoine/hydroxyectoine ABC transporter substrate-binding protein EhuB [Marinitenerispora sediminis]RCV49634.1 ectoine/hydroxyectoine ABC transporter substrate-binding protein EhuB [Marinitenerispora sediminis]RCV53116.1 ectoine/hydroxyectoine ABC transporter substrate-binding protein EhuB [Marinitenerispora sediminis]RCV57161.1 ectoine/hydroxyectoine ABC transporter substrate-binding protein EhuB [Marinitenerispora sediminis]
MTRYTQSSLGRRRFLARAGGAGVAALLGPTLLSSCSRVGTGNTFDRIREQGYINVGFANEAPYGFTDLATGQLTGEAPELARAVFRELGVPEVRGTQVQFGGLIPGLLGGQFDMVAAGMSITPDRCAQVAFTDPDFLSRTAFLVPEGNPERIERFTAFTENPDLVLCVLNATVEQEMALAQGVPAEQIQTAPDTPSAYELLQTGRIDAVALTSISLRWMLDQRGGPFEVTDAFFPADPETGEEILGGGGFALRPADRDLVDAFDAQLAEFKDSGRLLEIIEPFGFTEQELPGDLTARQLCEAA